jgi:hypothetical protein
VTEDDDETNEEGEAIDDDGDGEQDDHGEQDDDGEQDDHGAEPVRWSPIDPSTFQALAAFRDAQRYLAGLDFTAIRAAQQYVASLPKIDVSGILAAQRTISESVARSIDFARIAQANESILKSAQISANHLGLQKAWAESLAQAIDFSAFESSNAALLSNVNLATLGETQRAMAAGLASYFDSTAIRDTLRSIQSIDWSRVIEEIDSWLPINLRDVDALDAIARVTLEEGIPLSWVPRADIVQALVDAPTPEDRARLLEDHHDEILDDCERALVEIGHEWAQQCAAAIGALRAGWVGPAQSHAAGIIDSIVLRLLGQDGRKRAKERAAADFDDLPLRIAAESLVLRPLYQALTTWWPSSGDPPPDRFARHSTAHAVGHPGVFARRHALIAVMLATSLTVQFWNDPASAAGLAQPEPS